MHKSFWDKTVYDLVVAGCGLFIFLTVIAMQIYPGGTFSDANTAGYSFWQNFFSELGFTVTHNGTPNPIGSALFFAALMLAGLGMGLFFTAFPRAFASERRAHLLARAGSAAGIASALCFIGVAFTPANLYLDWHKEFVVWAFRLFPLAVLLYTLAMARARYARPYLLVFIIFWLMLVGYILLLELGPDIKTFEGMLIQAAGQKVIVYASIISVVLQSLGARRQAAGSSVPGP
jgi:hypothetical protein